ncbi:hypothetical protein [Marinobacterium rhizophilum]|uniref:hypothetical protein n=1 Tax=Marinobacterium rhizophilum TaxID=420402 RepID=UPI00035DCBC3|nr:hypothetical protein [Marinobacterium rhizophilum]
MAASAGQAASWKKYALAVATVLVLGGVVLFPRFYNNVAVVNPAEVIRASDCDLATAACIARGEGLDVTLGVTGTLASYEPVTFIVTVHGMTPDAVNIEFEGVEMFMGINQLALVPDDEGRFSGTLALPGHAHAMTWRARVLLYRAGTLTESEFIFDMK